MARYCLLLLLLNILANFIDLSFTSPIPQQDIFSLYGMSQNQQQMSPLNQQNQLFGSPINGQQQQSSPFGQNPYQQMMPYGQQAMPVFHQDQQQLLALQRQQQNQLYAGGIYGSGKGLPYMQQQFSDGRMRATPNLANSGSPIPLSKV
jgi:hypothetical protein